MVADVGHSLSDLLSDIATLWLVCISNLPANDENPYRHGRYEALGALAISSMLCSAAYGFGAQAYDFFNHIVANFFRRSSNGNSFTIDEAYISPRSLHLNYFQRIFIPNNR